MRLFTVGYNLSRGLLFSLSLFACAVSNAGHWGGFHGGGWGRNVIITNTSFGGYYNGYYPNYSPYYAPNPFQYRCVVVPQCYPSGDCNEQNQVCFIDTNY